MPDPRRVPRVTSIHTRPVSRAQASNYHRKAVQHWANARRARDAGEYDSAVLLAVHCAIAAGDAACVARAGVRSSSPTHTDQVRLVRALFPDDHEAERAAKELASLLDKKHTVEYEARVCVAKDAETAVTRAERLLAWARRVVADDST